MFKIASSIIFSVILVFFLASDLSSDIFGRTKYMNCEKMLNYEFKLIQPILGRNHAYLREQGSWKNVCEIGSSKTLEGEKIYRTRVTLDSAIRCEETLVKQIFKDTDQSKICKEEADKLCKQEFEVGRRSVVILPSGRVVDVGTNTWFDTCQGYIECNNKYAQKDFSEKKSSLLLDFFSLNLRKSGYSESLVFESPTFLKCEMR